ncbi:Helix-turn-helix domain-containing protein [Lentzea albidocapillata subsp. violacea]|uniref:Helix-turn-helix domain-containing protein n=1 Tax=Lentzea albidocapillata subsp. violacea TaxID=128104 RepID=A0A1G8S726_9PSEU|nr:helix-turn-helix transcriptional regulator [Lentzea albidocapillata]SDJ25029.1 Helix-turn-helix domain-containing protein [Lentzea albidocapillata subsp. violacea]
MSGNPIKERRAELSLTQQEAARRADVSLATWRRFENTAGDSGALDGFRADNVQGFARALKLSVSALRQLASESTSDETPGLGEGPDAADPRTAEVVRLFNTSFTGNPLTPADAMALSTTIDFSPFVPTNSSDELRLDDSFTYEFAAFLKGEATIREVNLLCDLPELALTQVNNHWLVRMGERITRIGRELSKGRVPRPQCLADEYALWIVIQNTEPPQLGEVLHVFPELRTAEDVFGYDPDVDDPDDENAIRDEWMNRVTGGLLPPDHSHDHRRYDLTIMEALGQGIYDIADPRHPIRWFDRDDLRERCESELAFVRLSKEEQNAQTAEALKRVSATLFSPTRDA